MLVALSLLYSHMSVNFLLRSKEVQWSLFLHHAGNLELSSLVMNTEDTIYNEFIRIYICAALLAWVLMGIQGPDQSINFYIGSLHFVNWRLYLIICTLPALLSAVSLSIMPESPAYLLHVGYCIMIPQL